MAAKQIQSLKKEIETNKAMIQDFFDKKKMDRIEVEPDKSLGNANNISMITAQKRETIKLEYNSAKLKEKLDKELFNEIITKTYSINNIEGLIELMKDAGISPKEFKKYLVINEVVDKDRIKQLYEVGDITQEMLNGCYTAKLIKSITILERKGGTN